MNDGVLFEVCLDSAESAVAGRSSLSSSSFSIAFSSSGASSG